MARLDESSLIALATDIQLLSHRGKLSRSGLRREKSEFWSAVRYFDQLNLAKFAADESPPIDEMVRQAKALDAGVVETLLGENSEEANAAQAVLDVCYPEGCRQQDSPERPLPFEFAEHSWQRFYLAFSPRAAPSPTDFDFAEARRHYRFAKLRYERGEMSTPAILEFIAGRFSDERRKLLIDSLIQCASDHPKYYTRVTCTEWMATYFRGGGALAVGQGLAAALALSQACQSDESAMALDKHLLKTLPSIKSRFDVIAMLGRVATEAGITAELRKLLDAAANEKQWKQVLRDLAMPRSGRPCTITAQRLTCKMLHAYGMANYQTLVKFNRRIRCLQLDAALAEHVEAKLCGDKPFAAGLLSGSLDLAPFTKQAKSINAITQFVALSLLAIASFRSIELGSVSRGLSLLYRSRRDRKIDDQHYTRMMDALTADLPASMLLLNEVPVNMNKRLSRLFIPLAVAIELYDDTSGEEIRHLSDAYYRLGKLSRS